MATYAAATVMAVFLVFSLAVFGTMRRAFGWGGTAKGTGVYVAALGAMGMLTALVILVTRVVVGR